MKTTATLTIGCFCVRGKYKNGKIFEDFTYKALFRFPDTKATEDEICKEYSEFACTIADISLVRTKTAEINLASEYLKAKKKTANDTVISLTVKGANKFVNVNIISSKI